MKKSFLNISLLSCILLSLVYPQSKTFGVKIATTSAAYEWRTAYPQVSPPLKRLQGYNFAIYAQWYESEYFGAITQFEYSQRGNTTVYTDFYPLGQVEYVLKNHASYLSVPLFVKFRPINSDVSPFLLVGPRVDYLVKQNTEDVGMNVVYNHLKKWVLGYSISLGIESSYFLGINISLEARYNRDITNTFHDDGIEILNNAFDFWLGVGI
jgi:hypothetical protein